MSAYMNKLASGLAGFLLASWLLAPSAAHAQSAPASQATKDAHAALAKTLPLDDREDFELARRGLLARPEALIIKDAQGRVIWDMTRFAWLNEERPDTVNPSLWRQAQLNLNMGFIRSPSASIRFAAMIWRT